MNILFLYANEILPERGGVQRSTSVVADYFETKGINVFYLSLFKFTDPSETSLRQFFLPFPNDLKKNTQFFLDFLKEKKIDIVINESGISPEISRLAYQARKVNVKVLSTINNSILSGINNFSSLYKTMADKVFLGWLLPLTKIRLVKHFLFFLYKIKYGKHYTQLCRNSDRVILLSSKLKDELFYMSGRKFDEKIRIIPNPSSYPIQNFDTQNKKKDLLYVGRIDTIFKRVDLLLEIWQNLYKQFPEWQLKVVGGGHELEKVVDLSKKMELQRVFFEGFQNPIPYYQQSSVFCMTSSSESFGMVLLEAMQFGVVPVAFNSYPTITDIIDNEQNGILVTPFDCNEYSQKLASLMGNDMYRHEVSQAAYEKSKNFSIEKIGSKWFSLFDEFSISK